MGIKRYLSNLFRHDRNTKQLLNDIKEQMGSLSYLLQEEQINRKVDWLREKTMTSTEVGVSEIKYCNEEIVISLTSFGRRIQEVYLAVESIMQGTVKPNRIILWLSESERNNPLPITLKKQKSRGLQIEYCNDIRSYKKIIPAMKSFPETCVVTIDDDLIYEFDLLENIINTHIAHPDDICACRMHRIRVDENNNPLSYLHWDLEIYPSDISNRHFLTSGGGTLFPSKCFVAEFFDEKQFMNLCPYADDVWINAMAWLSGRKIRKVFTHSRRGCDFIPIRMVQDDALCTENTNPASCRNDSQIKAVFDKYDLFHFL